jgi:hypothetical protein
VTDDDGNPIGERIYDLGVGKYDLTVTAGPSYATRREEAAEQMTDLIRAFPPAAAVVGPHLARNLDWPGADDIAKDLEKLSPVNQQQQGLPPELQQGLQKMQARLQQLEQENAQLKGDRSVDLAKVQVDGFKADTNRMRGPRDHQAAGSSRSPSRVTADPPTENHRSGIVMTDETTTA